MVNIKVSLFYMISMFPVSCILRYLMPFIRLEPDFLECEVKWALGSITTNKASGGDGIPAELFQIWKMMLWKCSTQYASKFGKLSSGHRTGKGVFIPIPKKGNAKECSNYHTIILISHTNKVMLKMLQARLQQYMNHELPDVRAGFRKGRGTRDQIANICWIIEKNQENSRKTSTSASLTTLKPLIVWITTNCGKFLKRWKY